MKHRPIQWNGPRLAFLLAATLLLGGAATIGNSAYSMAQWGSIVAVYSLGIHYLYAFIFRTRMYIGGYAVAADGGKGARIFGLASGLAIVGFCLYLVIAWAPGSGLRGQV